jgi:predicted lipoprotein with Yx(FWY)xxD motif
MLRMPGILVPVSLQADSHRLPGHRTGVKSCETGRACHDVVEGVHATSQGETRPMTRSTSRLLLGLSLALLLAACGGAAASPSSAPVSEAPASEAPPSEAPASEAPASEAPASEAPTSEAPAAEATITLAQNDLGTILVDAEGMTLYGFTADAEGVSTCYDGCAAAWPPLIAEGEVTAGEGLDASLLTTVERTDGTMQVKYGDWPLYYWAQDQAAGDATGQGVNDVWFVVGADGELIGQ